MEEQRQQLLELGMQRCPLNQHVAAVFATVLLDDNGQALPTHAAPHSADSLAFLDVPIVPPVEVEGADVLTGFAFEYTYHTAVHAYRLLKIPHGLG